MKENDKIFISLEDCINHVADRQFLSKAQKEIMYREWANLSVDSMVLFDEKNRIIGFRPNQAIEKIECTVMIDPETGGVEIV